MSKTWILIIILLSSCSSFSMHHGLIDPTFGSQHVFREPPRALSASYTTLQAQHTGELLPGLYGSLGLGPALTQPLDGRSPLFGVELSSRLSYGQCFQVFIEQTQGIHQHESQWEGSDVDYALSSRFGVGLLYQASPTFQISVSYQWIHFSNGKSLWSDQMRSFFRLPKATENIGFESGAIFVGITWKL